MQACCRRSRSPKTARLYSTNSTARFDSGEEDLAQKLVDKIATSADCGRYQVPVQRRLAALRLNVAQLMMARGRPAADYDRLLLAAQSPEVLWQASATVGEVRFGERRFAEAAQAYDLAIEIIKNESLTPAAPSKFEIEGLIERSARRAFLPPMASGSVHDEKFVKTAKDQRDGTLGGLYSRSVRGIVPRSIPVPITFEYRTTTFTSVGQDAARELLGALQEQKPSRILLVGHTDVRGTARIQYEIVARSGRGRCLVSSGKWIDNSYRDGRQRCKRPDASLRHIRSD